MDDLEADESELLLALLRSVLGAGVRLGSYQVVNQQPDYRVLVAQLQQPKIKLVIKLAGPQAQMAGQFDRTAAIYRLVKQAAALPAPEVIACDVSLQSWPWRYLLLTYLPGSEWRLVRKRLNPAELALAQREIGAAVAQLHSIRFPAYGVLDGAGQVPAPERSGLAALREHARRIFAAERYKAMPHLQPAFLDILAQRASDFAHLPGAGLCHEDLHHSNILFARREGQWRLAAVLDFEKAWAGPVESDLARMDFWRGMTSPDFWAAYCAVGNVDDGYLQRRPVYQLLWCLEFAHQTRQHLADTRRVCQELGCAPIVWH